MELRQLKKLPTSDVLRIAERYDLGFNKWYQEDTFALWRQFCHVLANKMKNVKRKHDFLTEQVNENETMLEFIQNSEKAFEMEMQDLDFFSVDDLKKYVEFLDSLWCK